MTLFVSVQTYGEDLVRTELNGIGDRGGDMTPLWPAMIARMEAIEREQFATEGGRSGNRWPELDIRYLEKKFKDGQDLEIMRATEALLDALTTTGAGSTRITTTSSLTFGADLLQFRVQQDYSSDSNYPERIPIDLTEQDQIEFAQVMLDYVMGTRNRAGAPISGGRFASGSNPLRNLT